MTKGLVNINSLNAIANAIREKLGTTATYKPAEMAPAILSIPTGGTGEEIPKIYVPKKLEHQNIVITPSVLTAPAEIDNKLAYQMTVTSVDIEVVAAQGYTAGEVVINGQSMGSSKVTGYTVKENNQITATAAVKVGESPTLNVSGTVTFAQMPSDMYEAFGATDGLGVRPDSGLGEIVNSTSQYPVIEVMSMALNGSGFFEITMKDLYKFFEKFETPRLLSFKVTIGSLQLDMAREEHSSISGAILPTHFNYLKSNIGKPLNFSIKYE